MDFPETMLPKVHHLPSATVLTALSRNEWNTPIPREATGSQHTGAEAKASDGLQPSLTLVPQVTDLLLQRLDNVRRPVDGRGELRSLAPPA